MTERGPKPKREPDPYDPKRAYGAYAVKMQLQYGEIGEDIIRMVTQYIAEGWMDFEQGLNMLHGVFEPEERQ